MYIMPCICYNSSYRTFTNMTQDDILAYLVRETSIQANQTTRNIYKLKSRSDPRPSSAYIGLVTSVVMGSLLVLVVISDIPKVYTHLKGVLSCERLT